MKRIYVAHFVELNVNLILVTHKTLLDGTLTWADVASYFLRSQLRFRWLQPHIQGWAMIYNHHLDYNE